MPAPSQLSISTSALNRLVKEEASYRKEYEDQQARIAKIEASDSNDENAEYTLKQERRALEETKAMFPQLKAKIEEAKSKLEARLEQDKGPGDQSSPEDITKAKEAIASALGTMRATS
ncbi:tubulin binding cofactor A [Lecanosticta acicola]|uniref:Tubulin-specific chaperone A n=1 Tax=Lecanosticta acicola TaxID=111012 RepID=A0AAI9E8Y5_9PEZI|nr:tubulin binding cofactor A [Lecanosticta acicola]